MTQADSMSLLIKAPNWNEIQASTLNSPPTLIDQRKLELDTSDGLLFIELNESGVRLLSEEQGRFDYGLLVNQPKALILNFQKTDSVSSISAGHLRVTIHHSPLSFEVFYNDKRQFKSADDGHFVRKHRVPPIAKTSQGWWLSWALKSSEPMYGGGEKWGALNKRGQLIRSYNHDALGVNAEVSYKNVPFCWSPEGWSVFFHTPSAVTHACGYPDWSQRSYCTLLEDDHLDVFIFIAEMESERIEKQGSLQKEKIQEKNNAEILLKQFTALTGRAPMPPVWSGGVILSKAYYKDADEIISVAEAVREKSMPCDVITFDGRAWQDTDTRFAFEWCGDRYPNPEQAITKLKALNFKICVWEYPLISVQHPWFDEFAKKGWLLTDKRTGEAYQYEWDQQAFGSVLTPLPNSGIVDFTHPDAYDFWRDAHQDLFNLGVDMIKADFGEQVEDDNMLGSNGESGLALHNVYAHLYNRCVYEAAERYSKSGAFLFSRSGWTGSQRFNSQWGGDPQADWEGMMSNVRGGLSWGLSGAPFYATDVGGFYKDTRDDALYVRWAQAAIFSAHFRLHGIGEREPWTYSAQAEEAVNQALRLRYQLQAYLRRTQRQSNKTGLPVQRPMVLAFPNEKQSWSFENQFMFGDDLLVVPCFDVEGEVELYLPEGHWFLFNPQASDYDQSVLVGGKVYQLKLALNEMAVFAQSGSQIPLSEAVQFTGQFSNDGKAQVIEGIPITQIWKAQSNN